MSESERDRDGGPARPGFLDRLRHALGIAAPSLRDDIEDALEQPDAGDDFSPHEKAILRNVLGLHEHRVHDIMIPRADIVAVGIESSLANVLSVFRTAGHSRLPVHGDTLDDPRGMVHIRDFVDYVARAAEDGARGRKTAASAPQEQAKDSRAAKLAALGAVDLSTTLASAGVIRPVLFVPPSMPALDLLVKMQATRTHMALVIDEYGGTDGLVSIEDVVEMIVGDIEDEHDLDEEPRIEKISKREYLVDARADLKAVREQTGLDLAEAREPGDFDTVGGLVTSAVGRVPARGEIIRFATPPLEFEVVEADPRRIKRVRIRLPQPDSETSSDDNRIDHSQPGPDR